MFSLDEQKAQVREAVHECYFPLSWDVLIRYNQVKTCLKELHVISRYLGMFSLDY